MIRLPSTYAAITSPLITSTGTFPGVPIGRSVRDRRPFHLSPVMVDSKILPSTNSLALGGLGSGKSATDKVQIIREIREYRHQCVAIDSYGETKGGEWGATTLAVGGRIIRPGEFKLNPCSPMLPRRVREQLIRSLIIAVDPDALTTQSGHALQHALQHPKAVDLNGVVDALVFPEAGPRWSVEKLELWGEKAAIALSRYTEGSLTGLFDGQEASLPPSDSPMITFDFTSLDRNSPAIPALMAAISVWIEYVWLPQSTAPHRHLVLEEAWEILRSDATAGLIQRLLKNSRKANLSIHALMHTLSDLGEGRALDLAKLVEVAHVGRLSPEEAAHVGAVLGLPDWAIAEIPSLEQGEAVWKVGPHHCDIVMTLLSEEEARLTDTSSRRREAQEGAAPAEEEQDQEDADEWMKEDQDQEEQEDQAEEEDQVEEDLHVSDGDYLLAPPAVQHGKEAGGWDFEMPLGVIDSRHYEVVRAAQEGRFGEATDLAVLGEGTDIRAHGINSPQALSWLSTRAKVAELSGSPDTATQLRATVSRMGGDVEWWSKEPADPGRPQAEIYEPPPPAPEPVGSTSAGHRRRTWPYAVVIAAVALTAAGIVQTMESDKKEEERQQKAAAYKGKSGASIVLDDVNADLIARWTQDHSRVIIELSAPFDADAKLLRIDASGESVVSLREDDRYTKPPELELPVKDPLADVTVQIEIGGRSWQEGGKGTTRTVRLSPTGVAYDVDTGAQLPPN